MSDEAKWALGGIGGLVVLIVGFAFLVGVISYYGGRSACTSWGRETNREVKFSHLVEVGIPLTWECFTPDEGGRWIPKSRVRDID